jgi:hypothetical protein
MDQDLGGRHVEVVLVLPLTALAILVVQLIADVPVIKTRVGMSMQMQASYAYAGLRWMGI